MKETLVNFENEKQKKSGKKNNYTDYIKSKIQNISEKTEKEYKIEFLLHRFSLENTKENLEILDLFCENINFNLESIGGNLKQNFASGNYEIIKYFFENFEINTLEKFQNLSSLITCREKQNIKLIVEKLEIKDESDLLEIIDVIRYTKLNLLEFFLNKDFVNSVYDLKKIENILLYTKEAEVIYFLVEYFKVNSLEEINILNIFGEKEISQYGKNVISLLIDKLNISNLKEYEDFFGDESVFLVLKRMKSGNSDKTMYLFNFIEKFEITSIKDFIKFFYKYDIDKIVNFNLFSYSQAFGYFSLQSKEHFEKIYKFLDNRRISTNKNCDIIKNLHLESDKLNEIIDFYLTYKKPKSLLKIFDLMIDLEDLKVNFDLEKIKTFDDYKDKKGFLKYEEIVSDFEKLLSKIDLAETEKQKALQSLKNYIKTKNDSGLCVFMSKFAIPYYQEVFHKKVIESICNEVSKNFYIKKENIDLRRIERIEFIEAFKMYNKADLNKKDFAWILKNYLLGNFDNIEEQKQFDTGANRAWLKLNLNEEQQKIWLSKNKETFFYEKGEQSKEKVEKIIIEKELDPLNILMMGNRVNGSCFSFYSPGKNFAYAVANAVDVNKGVFFIKNEKGNLIGRTCITIGKNKNLVNYKIYKTGLGENLELDYIFAEYLAILSRKMKMMISSKKVPTDTIECKEVYFDL
ncbi:hypothetical protein BLD25_04915 [Candidatus Gracilibacteria bacterium GN02-872]|nr:hypothetical protein BLD25_04915 [Candidatus Gracilibacteria bacterium GN02-872]